MLHTYIWSFRRYVSFMLIKEKQYRFLICLASTPGMKTSFNHDVNNSEYIQPFSDLPRAAFSNPSKGYTKTAALDRLWLVVYYGQQHLLRPLLSFGFCPSYYIDILHLIMIILMIVVKLDIFSLRTQNLNWWEKNNFSPILFKTSIFVVK